MKKLFNLFLICAILGVGTLNSSVYADAQTTQNLETLAEVTKADPDKPVLETLTSQDSQTLESKQGDLELEIDLKDKEITIKQNDSENIEISLPENLGLKNGQKIGDSVVFDGTNVDVVVQAVGGGIRQVLNIDNALAGNSFDFSLGLKNDESANISPEGFVEIKNKNGELVTSILKPWAKDKNSKELKTYYSISGDSLIQHIDYKGAVFPVSADPTWCGNQIHSVEWLDRQSEGGITLSIEPTWCGRTAMGESGFKEVVSKAPYHDKFNWDERKVGTTKYKVMRQQYLCHFQFATWKSRWNLEPWRPLVEWRQLINHFDNRNNSMCNPKA